MSEEIKHPNTPDTMIEQDKGRCAPASGSAARPKVTPAAGWVIARALKIASERADGLLVIEDIEAAIREHRKKYNEWRKQPNDQALPQGGAKETHE